MVLSLMFRGGRAELRKHSITGKKELPEKYRAISLWTGKQGFMKKASIVSIGNELLSGQTINTNAAYLSGELLSNSIPVVSLYTIGDETDAILRALDLAVADADIVLVTGGLGPTDDDLTRQAFASYLGTELQLQPEILDKLEKFFKERNPSPKISLAFMTVMNAPGSIRFICSSRIAVSLLDTTVKIIFFSSFV